jgi:hypothetical protein
VLRYAKRGYAITVPGHRPEEVLLVASRWGGPKILFDAAASATADVKAGDDEPTSVEDYIEAEGLQKLLIANLAGRSKFSSTGRNRFIPNESTTAAVKELFASFGDDYGPRAPYVNGANRYACSTSIDTFLRPSSKPSSIVFVTGPIPTGAAAGFSDPLAWYKGCYRPPPAAEVSFC